MFPDFKYYAPRYNWNIVESGVKYHQTNKNKQTSNTMYIEKKFMLMLKGNQKN